MGVAGFSNAYGLDQKLQFSVSRVIRSCSGGLKKSVSFSYWRLYSV